MPPMTNLRAAGNVPGASGGVPPPMPPMVPPPSGGVPPPMPPPPEVQAPVHTFTYDDVLYNLGEGGNFRPHVYTLSRPNDNDPNVIVRNLATLDAIRTQLEKDIKVQKNKCAIYKPPIRSLFDRSSPLSKFTEELIQKVDEWAAKCVLIRNKNTRDNTVDCECQFTTRFNAWKQENLHANPEQITHQRQAIIAEPEVNNQCVECTMTGKRMSNERTDTFNYIDTQENREFTGPWKDETTRQLREFVEGIRRCETQDNKVYTHEYKQLYLLEGALEHVKSEHGSVNRFHVAVPSLQAQMISASNKRIIGDLPLYCRAKSRNALSVRQSGTYLDAKNTGIVVGYVLDDGTNIYKLADVPTHVVETGTPLRRSQVPGAINKIRLAIEKPGRLRNVFVRYVVVDADQLEFVSEAGRKDSARRFRYGRERKRTADHIQKHTQEQHVPVIEEPRSATKEIVSKQLPLYCRAEAKDPTKTHHLDAIHSGIVVGYIQVDNTVVYDLGGQADATPDHQINRVRLAIEKKRPCKNKFLHYVVVNYDQLQLVSTAGYKKLARYTMHGTGRARRAAADALTLVQGQTYQNRICKCSFCTREHRRRMQRLI